MSTKTSKETKIRRGVGVYIVDKDGRYLMTQRGPKARHEAYCWEGPGGEVEDDETFEQAVDREIQEEIGIKVKLTSIVYESDNIIDAHGVRWYARVYLATTDEIPVIQEPEKCVGFGWFTMEELDVLKLATYARKDVLAIKEALKV